MNKTERGQAAEDLALAHLQRAGLRLVQRNYKTPGRGGGEIDLIMQDKETLVFVEVRQRASDAHGSGADSVATAKQRRLVFAARYFLLKYPTWPPCRFDVVSIHGVLQDSPQIVWHPAAFDAA